MEWAFKQNYKKFSNKRDS